MPAADRVISKPLSRELQAWRRFLFYGERAAYRAFSSNRGAVHICAMHVITRKRLNEFAARYPETRSALAQWYAVMRKARFANLVHLRQTFPHADLVGKFTVFDIGGNKVRLIAAIHYDRGKL